MRAGGGWLVHASPRRAPAPVLPAAARTHFVTITGPSLGQDCFSLNCCSINWRGVGRWEHLARWSKEAAPSRDGGKATLAPGWTLIQVTRRIQRSTYAGILVADPALALPGSAQPRLTVFLHPLPAHRDKDD